MAAVFPESFDAASLASPTEQKVLAQLQTDLSGDWLILPGATIQVRGEDRDADIVLLHPDHGVVSLTVRDLDMSLFHGLWVDAPARQPIYPQPPRFALTNARLLAEHIFNRTGLTFDVTWAVVLPETRNLEEVPGGLDRFRFICREDLGDIAGAVETLVARAPSSKPMTPDAIRAVVDAISDVRAR